MSRTFTSSKAAIGYALAVQSHAAGAASRRDSAPGPKPDQWLASSIFACFARAGLDPHDLASPVLEGVLAWAVESDGARDGEDSRVGSAIRRVTDELVEAGIVDPTGPTLERAGWRAVKLDGNVRFVSTTHLDAEGVALDREQLRADVEAGRVAPLEQVAVVPDRNRARAADVECLRPLLDQGWLDLEGFDRALASLWGCSPRTARRHRARLGVQGTRGPTPRTRTTA